MGWVENGEFELLIIMKLPRETSQENLWPVSPFPKCVSSSFPTQCYPRDIAWKPQRELSLTSKVGQPSGLAFSGGSWSPKGQVYQYRLKSDVPMGPEWTLHIFHPNSHDIWQSYRDPAAPQTIHSPGFYIHLNIPELHIVAQEPAYFPWQIEFLKAPCFREHTGDCALAHRDLFADSFCVQPYFPIHFLQMLKQPWE
jgi:hypothetical protein